MKARDVNMPCWLAPKTKGPYPLALILATAIGLEAPISGCTAGYHIRRIEADAPGTYYHAHKLGKYPPNKRAEEVLIDLLENSDDPADKYFAAEALDRHLGADPDGDNYDRGLHALVGVLDDKRTARVSWPIFGPFLPGVSGHTGSVRARALLTLTLNTDMDFGFEQECWREWIDEAYPIFVSHPFLWHGKLENALEQAKRGDREILILFADADCQESLQLNSTLHDPDLAGLFDECIHCWLYVDSAVRKKNAAEYGVNDVPALVLIQPDGESHLLSGLHTAKEIKDFVIAVRKPHNEMQRMTGDDPQPRQGAGPAPG